MQSSSNLLRPEVRVSVRSKRRFPIHVLVFLAPALVIYSVFMILPILSSLRLSLYNGATGQAVSFVGLKNYVTLLTNPNWVGPFLNALKNNVIFFVIHMLVQNPIALLLAALLTSGVRGASVYRTLIFTPTVLSVVIIGFVWNLLLNPQWGVLDTVMGWVGVHSDSGFVLLGDEKSALVTLSLISVWQNVGIPLMLFVAALVRVPQELVEAAIVDGAGAWTTFWKLRFPLILPTVGIVAILTFIGNFNAFDLIYAVQGALAGPNFSTDILGTFFYRTFFGFQLQPGSTFMGATVAGAMLLLVLAGLIIYLAAWQRRVQTYEY